MLRYTYNIQDNEANRELRMLRELRENKSALQFADIFPQYEEVLICGCNELAVAFADYLSELRIAVSVFGGYWDRYGYESCNFEKIQGGGYKKLIVYAEGVLFHGDEPSQAAIRSVSPEFECIDRIYEANVLAGNIKDTIGEFEDLVEKLKKEDEIIILGTDRVAQDAYDLLMANGIDICCFAVSEAVENKKLLARSVMSIEEAMQCHKKPIFINGMGTHGALGEKWTEYFDYRGYRRNQQYFLLSDYTDIPTSNLVHVLHGKNVMLTGDERLCCLLTEYLERIENGKISVEYIKMSETVTPDADAILCLVLPQVRHYAKFLWGTEDDETTEALQRHLLQMNFTDYTDYFICTRCFALIDLYLNKDIGKYTLPQLLPKGILIGRIPPFSGNIFFRGIMDGHPEVLSLWYDRMNNDFFYCCIRLAGLPASEIGEAFWKIVENEELGFGFVNAVGGRKWFDTELKRWLKIKEQFTSQELFVVFHAVVSGFIRNEQIEDVSQYVIYWEPHMVNRNEFPFYALWLEDEKLNGNTVVLCRNNVNRIGSQIQYFVKHHKKENGRLQESVQSVFGGMNRLPLQRFSCQYWKEHIIRFEDLKTKPQEMLLRLCDILHISWSDSLRHTTMSDSPFLYDNIADFDLKPVFNKYEDWLSEFDRFRLSIIGGAYQKKYGYPFEDCLRFTRKVLQEMFLELFLFDEKCVFKDSPKIKDKNLQEWLHWQLWEVRKHAVLDDVIPELERFELGATGQMRYKEYLQKRKECLQQEIRRSVEYIKEHEKVIFYGIGYDCERLLNLLDENIKTRLLYSDRKASEEQIFYEDKRVIAPEELRSGYSDYYIFVTSSAYRKEIEYQFEEMGINAAKVYYNRAEFGIDKEEEI